MKISENWLREWVPEAAPTAELVRQLTMAGLEVESVEPVSQPFYGVVVAEVLSTQKHPDSDHLSICLVSTGDREPVQIVCGAPNVRAGMLAPLARVGAQLGNGQPIKAVKLRGVDSAGMLCSAQELGLADARDGLLELPVEFTPGSDLWTVYDLADNCLEINITPNRGDCLSVAGLAREVALLNKCGVKGPTCVEVPAAIPDTFPVRIDAPQDCPAYAGRVIKGINPSACTPVWMLERLRRAGIRGIHPVVDITNYVMLELGQPMHAFDLDGLTGGIEVRRARAGEKLTLLDGQELSLDPSTLLIADADGALAMAGVMGGKNSGVSASTVNIFLESAYFSNSALAGQARRYGLQTDSSYRFERGVDFQLQARAAERATELLLTVVGGQPGPLTLVQVLEHTPHREAVLLQHIAMERLLGATIESAQVMSILSGLGMSVEQGTSAAAYHVTPPSFRFDIQQPADLVEEVVRIRGYESIPSDAPKANLNYVAATERSVPRSQLRALLIGRGYQEAITYSFVDPELAAMVEPDLPPKALLNPIAADMAAMRTSLWPGLLTALAYNLHRQIDRVRLFECGLVFWQTEELSQIPMLGGVIAGTVEPKQWGVTGRDADFFDLKSDVEALLPVGGATADSFRFVPASHPALHPGQCAQLLAGTEQVGVLGRLHPRLADKLDIPIKAVYLFQIRLSVLEQRALPRFAPVSKFPMVKRDISIVIDRSVSADAVLDCVRAVELGSDLANLELFDVYEGTGLDPGKKSIALGLTFQGSSSTLSDIDVEAHIERVLFKLKQQVGAILRS